MPRHRFAATFLFVAVVPALPPAAFGANGAVFVAQSVPAAMLAGAAVQVSVTMRNAGTTTWTPAGSYRLGSQDPQDNETWGAGRVELDAGDVVTPAEEKTFVFEVVAPIAPGTYSFQWRMVQEGVEWFGASTPAVAVVVSLPPPRYLSPDDELLPWQKQTVTLRWGPVPAAVSYTVVADDLTSGNSQTATGVTSLARNLALVPGHSYRWSVRAIDAASHSSSPATASLSVRANLPDSTSPAVSISRPLLGATVSGGVLVSVLASDDIAVERVELLVDGEPEPRVHLFPPYLFHWRSDTVADGPRLLTVTAFDTSGNTASTAVSVVVDNSEADCLPPGDGTVGDEVAINAELFVQGAAVRLCPGAVYHLQNPIQINAPDQDLHTQGFPGGAARARLVVEGGASGAAILGAGHSGLKIRNLRIDGNRRAAPRIDGDALILVGGDAQDLLVANVRAYDPRTWSTLHLVQGDPDPAIGCGRALVAGNDLGPSGHPGGEWADGISLACRDSRIKDNLITDATDGAIVVFAAPGSRIEANQIVAATSELLGGINLVDTEVFGGDYRGTVVAGNSIAATGAPIKIGLAMGWNVWSCVFDDANRIRGARVIGNQLSGDFMRYGLVANGVWEWSVSGNVSVAAHAGIPESGCGLPLPASPTAFLKDPMRASGNFQPEFVDGPADALLGVHD